MFGRIAQVGGLSSGSRWKLDRTLTAAEKGQSRLVTTGVYGIETAKEDGRWRVRKLDLFLDAAF